jgi:hypothetical protein
MTSRSSAGHDALRRRSPAVPARARRRRPGRPARPGPPGPPALRAARPVASSEAPQIAALEATDPVIDVWGDVALLRHVLRVRYSGGAPDEVVRNTSVWRRQDGRWLAVHNHEDVLRD